MAPIQRQNFEEVVTVGQDNDRSVGESDVRIAILRDNAPSGRYVTRREMLESVRATGHLVEKAEFCVDSYPSCQQVIKFGQHEGRQ